MPRVSRDLSAGACLLGIAAVATWQGADLELGTLRQMGPGMLPRVLAVLVGVCGGVLGVRSLLGPAAAPTAATPAVASAAATSAAAPWWQALRAPVFLLLAATAFGLCVRPLGLVVAAPLSILISTWASPESKRLESLWFALGMTTFCLVLFKRLLSLPIPVAPWLIGY